MAVNSRATIERLSLWGIILWHELQMQYCINLLIGLPVHGPVAAPSSSYRQLPSSADRVQVGGRGRLANGVVTTRGGVVKDHRGRPVPGVQVEIGQRDANRRDHHPRDRRNAPLVENFQGYGQPRTGAQGRYRKLGFPVKREAVEVSIHTPGNPLIANRI